jgi:hypothetical protein
MNLCRHRQSRFSGRLNLYELIFMQRRTIAMRCKMRFLAIPAACLGLILSCPGCGNTDVNETHFAGQTGQLKQQPSLPPPKTQKEYYERQQKQNQAAPKKAEAESTKGTS